MAAGLCTLLGLLAVSPAHLSTINSTPLSLYPLANDPFANPVYSNMWPSRSCSRPARVRSDSPPLHRARVHGAWGKLLTPGHVAATVRRRRSGHGPSRRPLGRSTSRTSARTAAGSRLPGSTPTTRPTSEMW